MYTCAPGAVEAIRNGLARETGASLTVVGEMLAGPGSVTFVDATGRAAAAASGWQHFAPGHGA